MRLPLRRTVILDILSHFSVGVVFALLFFFVAHNPLDGVMFALGSFVLDFDHLIDHFAYHKNKFSVKDFFGCTFLRSGKAYVFLHSWEIVFCTLLLSIMLGASALLIFALSLSTHLAIDSLQRKNQFFYFLVYRAIKKFNGKILLPEYYPVQ